MLDLLQRSGVGDTLVNKISAVTGEGVEDLLENILLIAEMQELKANPKRYATGAVLESQMDKHMGSVVTLLIQNGTLRLGDPIVVGTSFGKVRTLKNDLGQNIVLATPSMPVEITGLSKLQKQGTSLWLLKQKNKRKLSLKRVSLRAKKMLILIVQVMTLDDLFGQINEGLKEINVVLKTDVTGSLEAVRQSLEKIDVEGVKVNIIRASVGAITESDIVLAQASQCYHHWI